jgi:DNA (cytosine-5)-methyltransferase 1
MKYLSLCSGIEAATVAWHPLGWEAVAYSEIERFPSEVLAHHYPNTPNLGDMTKFKEWTNVSNVDVLVGGTPCQSFSVAGLRKGLDDPRGNLMLTYLAIADKYRPKWLVWENVPGVLSSNGGLDFASFLRGLGELGYGFAYRVLDAQYFGVAQRRRRVFVVGYLGDWQRAAAVLFERDSLQGNLAPSREKRESVATSVGAGADGGGCDRVEVINALCAADAKGVGNQYLADHKCVVQPIASHDVAGTMLSRNTSGGFSNSIDHAAGGYMAIQPIALAENTIGRKPENGGNGDGFTDGGPMYTLNATGVHGVAQSMAVRRLTPVECERLQGFPDTYTDIKSKGKATPDGPRYKALGNSMAVPVMAWIGKRINEVEELCKPNK